MPDVLTSAQRSLCMARNRGANTGPEIKLRKALHKKGFRYRLGSTLPGRPDIVFPASKTAVFVDGCFWHGCPLHAVSPKNNADFWATKIKRNKVRDLEVAKLLRALGWRVIRIWEHDVRSSTEKAAKRVAMAIEKRRRILT